MDLLSQINAAFPTSPPSVTLADGPVVRIRYDDTETYTLRTQRDMTAVTAFRGWVAVSAEVDAIPNCNGGYVVSVRLAPAPLSAPTPPPTPTTDVDAFERGRSNSRPDNRSNKPR